MSENPEMPFASNSTTTCSNCHSAMPSELRFCRNCGFRLTDGGDTESVRFPSSSGAVSAPIAAKKRRKMSGMAWVFVGLLVFFVGAAAFTALIGPRHRNRAGVAQTPANRSYAGVKEWETTENKDGATFTAVYPPGGPADKAGLVGGDVIVKFDGQRITNEDEMAQALIRAPVGKTVDVEYLRDGESRTTKLTTATEDEIKRLTRAFEDRPREQRARFGYEDGESERVAIPGTKIAGVRLDEIYGSMPADIAGVKEGDVVIEFDGIPIRTPGEMYMRVMRSVPYSTVKLVVMRGEEKVEIPVKMGRQ
ncbi:MAG TPA: PDZ domain-containing protein [Pyrinomonadaceae bacterium]|nr:PDZ domain-containing protein [Pyrinomonadaceae bacterium]